MNQRHATIASPYVACYILLRRKDTLAFVLRSHTGWMDGNYSLPAGRVEKNEPVQAAAVREAQEEVGVVIKQSDLQHRLTVHRNSEGETFWIDVFFEAMHWQGEPYNAEPDKHGELVWLDPVSLPDNMVPYVRYSLQQISTGQTYAEYGWEN